MELEIISLYSPDLEYGEIPIDGNALMQCQVGVRGENDSLKIYFAVLTVDYLRDLNAACWGFGKLIVPEFDWNQIEGLLRSEISNLKVKNLEEAKTELSKKFGVE